MITYRGTGKRVRWTNSTGSDVASGDVVVIGDRIGVAVTKIANGDNGALETEGVHQLAAASADTWDVGSQLYWDATAEELITDSYENAKAGFATLAKAALTLTGKVKLNH